MSNYIDNYQLNDENENKSESDMAFTMSFNTIKFIP